MSAVADVEPWRHRFTRERYEEIVEAGIFGPEDRVELLDGEIVEMAPQKSLHATAVSLHLGVLTGAFGDGFHVRAQMPLALGAHSEPEPDIAVVRGKVRDYRDEHPQTAVLIVEVAHTTLAYDRGRKLAAYARAGIPEYWVHDIAAAAIEAYRGPQGERYAEKLVLRAGDRVKPLHVRSEIAVSDLLP